MVSTPCVDCGEPNAQTARTPPHGSSAVRELLGEDPAVARVAHRVDDRLAHRDVVGLVEVGAAPGVPEVAGDHDVRAMTAYDGRDRGPQRHAVLEDAVRQAEEVDLAHADDARRLDLLRLADHPALVRAPCRRCRPRRWSPCSRRPACPDRSSGPPRRPRRTPGRRGARRRTAPRSQSSSSGWRGGGASVMDPRLRLLADPVGRRRRRRVVGASGRAAASRCRARRPACWCPPMKPAKLSPPSDRKPLATTR